MIRPPAYTPTPAAAGPPKEPPPFPAPACPGELIRQGFPVVAALVEGAEVAVEAIRAAAAAVSADPSLSRARQLGPALVPVSASWPLAAG